MKSEYKKLYLILITYCKRFHPKSTLYEKMKITTKRTIVLESFITIGSFDYDRTLTLILKYLKKSNLIP
jgi:hypothetical protein